MKTIKILFVAVIVLLSFTAVSAYCEDATPSKGAEIGKAGVVAIATGYSAQQLQESSDAAQLLVDTKNNINTAVENNNNIDTSVPGVWTVKGDITLDSLTVPEGITLVSYGNITINSGLNISGSLSGDSINSGATIFSSGTVSAINDVNILEGSASILSPTNDITIADSGSISLTSGTVDNLIIDTSTTPFSLGPNDTLNVNGTLTITGGSLDIPTTSTNPGVGTTISTTTTSTPITIDGGTIAQQGTFSTIDGGTIVINGPLTTDGTITQQGTIDIIGQQPIQSSNTNSSAGSTVTTTTSSQPAKNKNKTTQSKISYDMVEKQKKHMDEMFNSTDDILKKKR